MRDLTRRRPKIEIAAGFPRGPAAARVSWRKKSGGWNGLLTAFSFFGKYETALPSRMSSRESGCGFSKRAFALKVKLY